jgi:hypothetical protein
MAPKAGGPKEGQPSLSLEVLLYGLVVLLAVWLRFARLDLYPLTDREAEHALAASTTTDLLSESPAHQTITRLAFTFIGESESSARWAAALAGVALVLTPVLLRRQIGRGPAFLGALLLAISPILWSVSRMADGTALAVLGITAAIFLLVNGRIEWSGAFLGLALVSGPAAFTGLASVGAGAGIYLLLRSSRRRAAAGTTLDSPFPSTIAWRRGLATGGIVALFVATGAGFFPDSLPGFFEGLGRWVNGWFQGSGIAFVTLLLMLLAYEPLVSVAGSIGVVGRLRKANALETFFASWAVGSLLVILLYRGRQPADMVWTVLPLTLLAALVVSELLERISRSENAWLALGFTGAIMALMAFAYLQLRAGVGGPDSFQTFLGVSTHFAAAVMGIGLAVLALILLAVGWSREVAIPVAGASAFLVFLGVGISAGAALNFGDPTARELFRPQASTLGLNALRESLRTLSRAETGQPEALPIEMRDRPSPALAWATRNYPRFEGSESPAIIIIREGASLPGGYLGQSVTIGETWGWNGRLPPDLLSWLVVREALTVPDRWVMLVRKDVAGVEELAPIEIGS